MISYEWQKAQLLADHALLSALGVLAFWALGTPSAAGSYAAGAGFGALYLVLKEKEADAFGSNPLQAMREITRDHTRSHEITQIRCRRCARASRARPRRRLLSLQC